jgi:hypothetical protein
MTTPRAPFETLETYVSGEMPEADANRFEDELFASASDGTAEDAKFADRIALIGRFLLPRGGFDIGSSRVRIDELVAAGLRVQVIDPEPAATVRLPAIEDDVDIVVTHIRIDIRGYDSVDIIVEKPDGTELKTFRDVGCDPTDGTMYAVCEAPLARISMQQRHIRSRVIGTRAGQQHVVAVFETVAAP